MLTILHAINEVHTERIKEEWNKVELLKRNKTDNLKEYNNYRGNNNERREYTGTT